MRRLNIIRTAYLGASVLLALLAGCGPTPPKKDVYNQSVDPKRVPAGYRADECHYVKQAVTQDNTPRRFRNTQKEMDDAAAGKAQVEVTDLEVECQHKPTLEAHWVNQTQGDPKLCHQADGQLMICGQDGNDYE